MSRKRKATKFRENQYIIITGPAYLKDKQPWYEPGIVVGFIYRQQKLSEDLTVNIYNNETITTSNYLRTSKRNWRFATTEEVAIAKKHRNPVKVTISKHIDDYSII